MSGPSRFKLHLQDEWGQYSLPALFFSLLALSIWSLYRLVIEGQKAGLSSHKMQLVIAVSAAFCLFDLVSLAGTFFQDRSSRNPTIIWRSLYRLGKTNLVLLGILISAFGILVFGPTSGFYRTFFIRSVVYLHMVFIGASLLKAS